MHEFTSEELAALVDSVCSTINSMDYWTTANSPDINETAAAKADLFRGILGELVGDDNSEAVFNAYVDRINA